MANDPPPAKIIKAECPYCSGTRNAWVRGEHVAKSYSPDEGSSGSETGSLLQCCGCDGLFFKREIYFSEWEDIGPDPVTGQWKRSGGTKTTYRPAQVSRAPPNWVEDLELSDRALGTILSETYTALNNDLRILAAIGARTAFDHSSEKLGVDASLPFNKKLDELLKLGKISSDERQTLEVLVEAGSAAAHHGWRPKPAEINTMMDLLEALLQRAFVLGDGIKTLKAAVPPRQARKKS
jgi:hypothetical protein